MRYVTPEASGDAGSGQELKVAGRGIMLGAVFVHQNDIVLLLGSRACSLFSPGLTVEHRRGALSSELRISTEAGESSRYKYKRTGLLPAIIDPAYDTLGFELAHLPAALPSRATRNRQELVAEWSARAAAGQRAGTQRPEKREPAA